MLFIFKTNIREYLQTNMDAEESFKGFNSRRIIQKVPFRIWIRISAVREAGGSGSFMVCKLESKQGSGLGITQNII